MKPTLSRALQVMTQNSQEEAGPSLTIKEEKQSVSSDGSSLGVHSSKLRRRQAGDYRNTPQSR